MPAPQKLPPKGNIHETRLGTFIWEGPHLKWCCEESKLGAGLNLTIDDYEVTEKALKKIERIYHRSRFYLRIALFRAKATLTENGAKSSHMHFFWIGLGSDPFPEIILDFRYPDTIWPGGEMSVHFWYGVPVSVEQAG